MQSSSRFLALFAGWLLAASAAAQDGVLDTGFGGDGIVFWTGGTGNSVELADIALQGDGRILGVGTFTAGTAAPTLHFQSFRVNGNLGLQYCYVASSDLFPFSVESRGLSAIVDSSGNLLIGGSANFIGSEGVSRPLVARFALDQNGCVLDTTYSANGFEFFDDNYFCDTESCRIVDLGELRPETGAVNLPRVVALLEARVDSSTSRLILAGLSASGQLLPGFGVGGFRELTGFLLGALLTGDGNRLAIDGRGRIYVTATRHDPVQPSDDDVVLARFTAGGDLDATFGSNGVSYPLEDDAVNDYARDVAVLPDGSVLLAAERGSTGQALFGRSAAPGGTAFVFTTVGAAHATAVAGQGDGSELHAYEPAVDGGRVARWNGAGALDGSFGSGGIASYDIDLGAPNTDNATVMQLLAGRPVIGGTADRDATRTAGFLVRLTNSHIFADGFEGGTPAFWPVVVP